MKDGCHLPFFFQVKPAFPNHFCRLWREKSGAVRSIYTSKERVRERGRELKIRKPERLTSLINGPVGHSALGDRISTGKMKNK